MNGTRAKATALLTALQLAVAGALAAQASDVRDLFPARPDGFVTDRAGVLDETSKDRMTSLIERLRAATGAEIAVVTLPTIGDRSESEVALAIGRAWGVGARAEVGEARRNAGVVLLLVPLANHEPGTGRIRIEVGQGLEGIVTDAAAGRLREMMRPMLVREEYGPALATAVEGLSSLIARGMGVSDTALTNAAPVAGGGEAPAIMGLVPLLLLIVVFLVLTRAFAGPRRRRRVYWGGPWIGGGGGGGGGGWGGGGGGGWGGGGFGGFGGGGGFSGGGAGGRF